jgi:adenine-specific DNA methylase
MKCPKCGYQIPMKKAAAEMGKKGGKKSKRVLTPEQARKMVEARERKKKEG